MNPLLCLLLSLLAGLALDSAVAGEPFPRPPELEPDIRFWTRVYTEIDTGAGFIHDSRRLDIVYETMSVPPNLSRRAREARVEKVKKRYAEILRMLATGKRTGLTDEQSRLLSLWPGDTEGKEFAAAAKRLRFQLGQSDRFRDGMVRAGAWLPYIQVTFADMGLPVELAYLPHVESSFNPRAQSHASAVGLWQFTRTTGRRYLRIDDVVDERLDPFESTQAAARLLKANYKSTGTWPLALTSYNHGAAGMRRAARKLGTTDIATIARDYRSRSFGFASRNFYVSFLAVLDVERDADKYFGQLSRDMPAGAETVEVPGYLPAETIARALGVEKQILQYHNPSLRRAVWSGHRYVPPGHSLRLPDRVDPGTATAALAAIPASERGSRQKYEHSYRVAHGDTLSRIATRHGVSVSSLVDLNGLGSRHFIRAGQVLALPGGTGKQRTDSPARRSTPPADGLYVVRRGDTVSRIARRFGMDERALAAANGLSNRHRIYVGQTLKLDGAAPTVLASVAPASSGLPRIYRVRSGDTLSTIARRFRVSERELAALNDLANRHRIYIGQKLVLAAAPAPVPAAPRASGASTLLAPATSLGPTN